MATKEKETELEVIDVTDIKETFELTTPIEIDGEKVTEIEYNLNRITGKTIRIAIQQLGRMEVGVPNLEFSPILHATLFGEKVTEIEYNLNRITGKTIRIAIQQLGRMEVGVPNLEFSPILHATLFAFAADLDFHIVEKFNMKDYRRAVEIVSNFI